MGIATWQVAKLILKSIAKSAVAVGLFVEVITALQLIER